MQLVKLDGCTVANETHQVTHIDQVLPQRNREVERASRVITELIAQRDKLLQAHYAGAVPLDQLKAEQERIAQQLATAHEALDGSRLRREQLEETLDRALLLLERGGGQYAGAPGIVRRELNQAVFARFWLMDDEVADSQFTALFERLRSTPEPAGEEASDTTLENRKNLCPEDTGSNEPLLVAGTGFEPVTSGL